MMQCLIILEVLQTMADDIYLQLQSKYNNLQKQAQEACNHAVEELYRMYPQMKTLTDNIVTANSDLIRAKLQRLPKAEVDKKQRLRDEANANRDEYIKEHNIDMSVFSPKYTCSDCSDTGKLPNGLRCHCYSEYYSQLKFSSADMQILEKENFSTFRLDIFPEKTSSGYEQRTQMAHIKSALEDYCEKFPNVPKKNIFIAGLTGTGKSFLLNCVAKALSDKSINVIRTSAYKLINDLFDLYITDSSEFNSELEKLCSTDVLIIDDLGTELIKENFTLNTLYYILDRCQVLQTALVISTNLSPKRLEEKYSDRIMSRLFNTHTTNTISLSGIDVRIRRNV